MDILVEDSGQGLMRILITESKGNSVAEPEIKDTVLQEAPCETQTINYINACRAIFEVKQSMKTKSKTQETENQLFSKQESKMQESKNRQFLEEQFKGKQTRGGCQ